MFYWVERKFVILAAFVKAPPPFWQGTKSWGSSKPIYLKPGHLKMAFFSARSRLDGAFFV